MKRAPGRGGMARSALAGTLALLYLALSLNALTCALHHGLYGACPHHMGGAAGGGMAGMPADPAMPAGQAAAGVSGVHAGHSGPTPEDAPIRAAVALCHCLDNLAAEPPAPLLAAAVVLPSAAIAAAPVVVSAEPFPGPARPRAPPVHPA